MLIDCMLRALEVSWLYITLIAIVFIIIIIIIIIYLNSHALSLAAHFIYLTVVSRLYLRFTDPRIYSTGKPLYLQISNRHFPNVASYTRFCYLGITAARAFSPPVFQCDNTARQRMIKAWLSCALHDFIDGCTHHNELYAHAWRAINWMMTRSMRHHLYDRTCACCCSWHWSRDQLLLTSALTCHSYR